MSSRRSRSAGTRSGTTARRKKRSLRKEPASTAARRSRFVAERTRTSTPLASVPPTGLTTPSSSARSSFGWRARGISPISSRKSVPPSACSKTPACRACAPVKAPFSWPNSSDSISASGRAAQLRATKGPPARSERRWTRRATSSLPVPFSPVTRTRSLEAAIRSIERWRSAMTGESPRMRHSRSISSRSRRFSRSSSRVRSARRRAIMTRSESRGFSRKSSAPPRMLSTAIGMSPWPEIIRTAGSGKRSRISARTSRPSLPGILMSRRTASTRSFPRRASASSPRPAVRVSNPSTWRRSARVERMSGESSTIRTMRRLRGPVISGVGLSGPGGRKQKAGRRLAPRRGERKGGRLWRGELRAVRPGAPDSHAQAVGEVEEPEDGAGAQLHLDGVEVQVRPLQARVVRDGEGEGGDPRAVRGDRGRHEDVRGDRPPDLEVAARADRLRAVEVASDEHDGGPGRVPGALEGEGGVPEGRARGAPRRVEGRHRGAPAAGPEEDIEQAARGGAGDAHRREARSGGRLVEEDALPRRGGGVRVEPEVEDGVPVQRIAGRGGPGDLRRGLEESPVVGGVAVDVAESGVLDPGARAGREAEGADAALVVEVVDRVLVVVEAVRRAGDLDRDVEAAVVVPVGVGGDGRPRPPLEDRSVLRGRQGPEGPGRPVPGRHESPGEEVVSPVRGRLPRGDPPRVGPVGRTGEGEIGVVEVAAREGGLVRP